MPSSIEIPEAFSQSPILAKWTDNDGIEHPGHPLRPMRFSDAPRHPVGHQFEGMPIGGHMQLLGGNRGAAWVPGHATRNDKIARRFGAAGPDDNQAIQNRSNAMKGAASMMSAEQLRNLGIPKYLSQNSSLWDQWAAEKHFLGQRETQAFYVPRESEEPRGLRPGGRIPWGHL